MLSLHTNAAALSTQNAMGNTNKVLSTSMQRLGTGFRVNSAMDDAAGLQIATRLNAQARGMGVAQKNTQNSISMLQTAEGSMNEVGNMLLRMKDLATEAANGTSSADDKIALQAEFDALGSEISTILNNSSFAGSKLFSDGNKNSGGSLGSANGIKFQVGATAAETVTFTPAGSGSSLTKLLQALKQSSGKIELAPLDPNAPANGTDNLPGKSYNQLQLDTARTNAGTAWEKLTDTQRDGFTGGKVQFDAAVQDAISNPTEAQILAALTFDTTAGLTDTTSGNDAKDASIFGGSEAAYQNAIAAALKTPPQAVIDKVKDLIAADPDADYASVLAGSAADAQVFGNNADIFNAALEQSYKQASADQRYFAANTENFADLDAAGQALFGNATHFAGIKDALTAASTNPPAAPSTPTTAGNELTATDPAAIITVLDQAINAVGTFRSDVGAVANRLEHTYNNLGNMITNTNTAKGRIMDTDFAAESSNMTKNQMLMQVSTAMLKQSNSLSQMVGSLVQ